MHVYAAVGRKTLILMRWRILPVSSSTNLASHAHSNSTDAIQEGESDLGGEEHLYCLCFVHKFTSCFDLTSLSFSLNVKKKVLWWYTMYCACAIAVFFFGVKLQLPLLERSCLQNHLIFSDVVGKGCCDRVAMATVTIGLPLRIYLQKRRSATLNEWVPLYLHPSLLPSLLDL